MAANIPPPVGPSSATESPPSYAVTDPTDNTAELTAAEMNAAFANLNLPSVPPSFPTSDHCLAHLKLLNTFHALKEDVGYTDGLFGLWDARCEVLEGRVRDEALARTREKRWALYIARAVERFEVWWLKFLCTLEEARRLECKEMLGTEMKFMQFTSRGRVQKWTTSMLPPVDVLMVWHSFMLNPRNYLEDCIRFGLKDLWATGLPWAAVNEAIDTNFNYTVPADGMNIFAGMTGLNWSNADDPIIKTMHCPRCSQQLNIPWTTCGKNRNPSYEEITKLLGTGYGDRDFSYICHRCGGEINHKFLRLAKFRKDTEKLIMQDWPLGGTILSPASGAPEAPSEKEWPSYPNTFPNRVVRIELRSRILELTKPNSSKKPTMDDVKNMIETAVKDRHVIRRCNSRSMSNFLKGERLSIRKMMSRYWENASPFALELGGAVIRQSIFVEKMHNIDWLHSPAATDTMRRLLIKYARFIEIIASNPKQNAVPTLDLDLAWHTHQLSPKSYYDYSMRRSGKFIDHDDKMDEDALSAAFEWTSKTYEKLFQEVYSECTCWYCEAIRSRHISSSMRLWGTSKHEKVLDSFYDSGAAQLCPPDKSAHISSHSAVKPLDSSIQHAVAARLRQQRKLKLEEAYDKACRRAEAKGRPLPPRRTPSEYYGGWGYPYLMYGPYMAVGVIGGVYYAGDPCVMPVGEGMTGSCVAGTCGVGVAAGASGGPGGCAGGGACGSCGSGGGGGCGSSCGGGGCSS